MKGLTNAQSTLLRDIWYGCGSAGWCEIRWDDDRRTVQALRRRDLVVLDETRRLMKLTQLGTQTAKELAACSN